MTAPTRMIRGADGSVVRVVRSTLQNPKPGFWVDNTYNSETYVPYTPADDLYIGFFMYVWNY